MKKILSYWSLRNIGRKQVIDVTDNSLNRVLTKWHLLGYGIANTIGAGIFVVSGKASLYAGTGLALSFLISGFAALLSALCYAEYGARFPVAGSSYSFTYVSLGEALAWFVGWNMTLEYAVGASAVAAGWAGYLLTMITTINPDIHIPPLLNDYTLGYGFSFSPLAVTIIIVCTLVLFAGVQESATFNLVISVVNIVIIMFIVILGAVNFQSIYWDNYFSFGENFGNIGGIMQASATVFFSFIGFDAATCLAGETKNPSKDLPFSVIGTLIITTTLYVGVSIVLTGLVNINTINEASPLASAFAQRNLHWAVILISVGSVTTLTANVLGSLIAMPHVFYQMSADGLLFSPFKWINKRGVMTFGTLITSVTAGILALVYDLNSLTDMISIGTLMAYASVCAGVVMMRYAPDSKGKVNVPALQSYDAIEKVPREMRYSYIGFLEKYAFHVSRWLAAFIFIFTISTIMLGITFRLQWPWAVAAVFIVIDILVYLSIQILRPTDIPVTFNCPLVPLVPLLGVAINILLISTLAIESIYRVLIWSAIGAVIYLFYGIRFSNLNSTNNVIN